MSSDPEIFQGFARSQVVDSWRGSVMSSDPEIFQGFARSLAARDPKTVRAYPSALRGFAQWLADQPGGDPFSPEIITEMAVNRISAI